MGEAFGLYKMGDDEALMPLINVANVACGFDVLGRRHRKAGGCRRPLTAAAFARQRRLREAHYR